MQRNTGYFPTESLEPSGNRLFSRSALNEGDLFRGSLVCSKQYPGDTSQLSGLVVVYENADVTIYAAD